MHTPTQTRATTTRLILWLTGLALWVLVIVAGFVVWRSGTANVERPAPASGQIIVEEDATQPDASASADPLVVTPSPAEELEPAGWDPEGIEDFELTERSGRTITKADLLGKPWAVCFIFTTCAGPCLGISTQMKQLGDRLEDVDVRLVTITVNPDYDTPEVLSNYADAFGADLEKWLYLTGDKEQIYGLIQRSFKMPVQEMQGEDRKPGYEVLHTTNILLVDAEGRVVDKFNGTSDTEMVRLRRSMEELAEEAQSPSPEAAAPVEEG